MPARRFVTFDAAAATITVPIYVGLGYRLADDVARLTHTITQSRDLLLLIAVGVGIAIIAWAIRHLRAPPGPGEHREGGPPSGHVG